MIGIQKYHLEIISSVSKNIGSAFIFASFFAKNAYILIQSLAYAILFLGIVFAIESRLDKLR